MYLHIMQRHNQRRLGHGLPAFTLVEMLLVIAVIAMMIALLLPAMKKARERSRQMRCQSNTRQIFLMQAIYAQDHAGFFPPVTYARPNVPLQYHGGGYTHFGGVLDDYLDSMDVLRCPSRDPRLDTVPTGNYGGGMHGTTYFLIAGTGNFGDILDNQHRNFHGRMLTHGSIEQDPARRSYIPNLHWAGRYIIGYGDPYDAFGPIYIDEPDRQPALVEPHSEKGFWAAFGVTGPLELQARDSHRGGGNVCYVDGHVEWSLTSQSINRLQPYTGWDEINW